MSKKRNNIFSGNKATLIGIIIILFMVFISRNVIQVNNKIIPGNITFQGYRYTYVETISSSPFSFVKAKAGSNEGFRVLVLRKDRKTESPYYIYLYIGSKKYMKYKKTG